MKHGKAFYNFGNSMKKKVKPSIKPDVHLLKSSHDSFNNLIQDQKTGLLVEVSGKDYVGKSFFGKSFVSDDDYTLFIDSSCSLDKNYFQGADDVIIVRPETLEQSIEMLEMFVLQSDIKYVIIDSFAALEPKSSSGIDISKRKETPIRVKYGIILAKLKALTRKYNVNIVIVNEFRNDGSNSAVSFRDNDMRLCDVRVRCFRGNNGEYKIDVYKNESGKKGKLDITTSF